jgi:hypothetical protein
MFSSVVHFCMWVCNCNNCFRAPVTTAHATNSWHHVAVSNIASPSAQTVVYVDAKLRATLMGPAQSGIPTDLTVGHVFSNASLNAVVSFDELRLWNRSLSAADVFVDMTSPPSPQGLTVWYPFDEPVGSAIVVDRVHGRPMELRSFGAIIPTRTAYLPWL